MKKIVAFLLFALLNSFSYAQTFEEYFAKIKKDTSLFETHYLHFVFYDSLLNHRAEINLYRDNFVKFEKKAQSIHEGFFRVDTVMIQCLSREHYIEKTEKIKYLKVYGNEFVKNEISILDGRYDAFGKGDKLLFKIAIISGKPFGTWKFYKSQTEIFNICFSAILPVRK